MTNIDHADLAKLLKRKHLRSLILHLPASPSYGEHGWQLIAIEEVPVRAGKRTVGTLNRFHVVDVEPDQRLAAPEHTLHVTYGEAQAYTHLIRAEIAAAKRVGSVPRIMLRPTEYGRGDGPVVGQISDGCSRIVYTFAGYHSDVYLSVFGSAEPSDKWGAARWNTEAPSVDKDAEVLRYTLARGDGQ